MCMLLPAHTLQKEAFQQQREAIQQRVQDIMLRLSLEASQKDLLATNSGRDAPWQPAHPSAS